MSSTRFAIQFIAACAGLASAGGTFAHVSLISGPAIAGADYRAVLRVGHPCESSKTTSAINVRLPEGFVFAGAEPHAGWTLSTVPAAPAKPADVREVSWKADAPAQAIGDDTEGEFALTGTPGSQPGTAYFKVLQSCDAGQSDWAAMPTTPTKANAKPDMPAAALEVRAPGSSLVQVKDAWVRQTVPGQSGTAAFMTLTAPVDSKLIGASTPVAGVAQVHQMKMDGGTMRMREVTGGLPLPAGKPVELISGAIHLMLMDLKKALPKGSTVPVTLQFEDPQGAKSNLTVEVPAALTAAAAGIAAPAGHGAHDPAMDHGKMDHSGAAHKP